MALQDIEIVTTTKRASVLVQHPLRKHILSVARRPISAADIALELGEPRQKVNYHVRQLARAAFLKRSGRRLKRNMVEQRYLATARAYVLAPEVLGELSPTPERVTDALSAAHLVALTARTQTELGAVTRAAARRAKRVPTLSISADIRFVSPEQRAAFTTALQDALRDAIARHTAPDSQPDGSPGSGRPYRLVVGCYPTPSDDDRNPTTASRSSEDDG